MRTQAHLTLLQRSPLNPTLLDVTEADVPVRLSTELVYG